MKYIKMGSTFLLEKLFPNVCVMCDKVALTSLCETCKKKVVYMKEPRCFKCGKMLAEKEREYCLDCQKEERFFEAGRSIWIHKSPVAESIYRFKYKNRRVYAKRYAQEFMELYMKELSEWKIKLIVPIPLYNERKRKRGFNQAELIGQEISEQLGIPMKADFLKRVKKTKPQKLLSHHERKANLNGAFEANAQILSRGNILLVDDIYTTGATMNMAAKVMKEAGAQKVFFFTISIGQGF